LGTQASCPIPIADDLYPPAMVVTPGPLLAKVNGLAKRTVANIWTLLRVAGILPANIKLVAAGDTAVIPGKAGIRGNKNAPHTSPTASGHRLAPRGVLPHRR